VKILDFGIAKVTEGRNTTSASGTPLWLAPEQTTRGIITPAADVWAMGLLVFDMIVGRVFWRTGAGPNQSIAGLLSEIMVEPIPYASQRAAEFGRQLPPGFDGWFARCVVRDPAMRFAHARQAFAELVPILRPPRVQQPVQPLVQPKPQSSGWGCVIGIVLALLIVAAAAVWGVYVLVKKGEEVADEAVSTLASAANSAVQAIDASAPPPVVSAPSASAAIADEPSGLRIMTVGDATLHDDADRQLNLGLDKKFAACAAKQKRKKLAAQFAVQIKADGHVTSVNKLNGETGLDMQCFSDTIKTMTFSATRTGGTVMLFITSAD